MRVELMLLPRARGSVSRVWHATATRRYPSRGVASNKSGCFRMDLQLKGKTALVTGASQGIGRAIAIGLAAEGAQLAIAARRKELLQQLAETIAKAGGATPALIVADVMEPDSARRIAAEAMAALGKIEILVNSAGGSRPIPVEAPDSIWDEAL